MVCTEVCGNSIITISETCDDGNMINNDGCSSACLIETGFTCSNSLLPSTCSGICGDGLRVVGEACDDGSKLDGIGCLASCAGSVSGYHCFGGTFSSPDVCFEMCGDGVIT